MPLEWKDPPPSTSTRRDTQEDLNELRMRPGEWALMSTHASQNAANTRAYRLKPRYPHFEFTTRATDDGGELYGRFIGGDDDRP